LRVRCYHAKPNTTLTNKINAFVYDDLLHMLTLMLNMRLSKYKTKSYMFDVHGITPF